LDACPAGGKSQNYLIIKTHPTKTLIVGAGLAGSLLAWRLLHMGQAFHLIGSSQLPNAWSVAAGVINPVTGRWMTKSWAFDTLRSQAQEFYRALEQQFQRSFFHTIPLTRYCQQPDDLKRLGRRMRNPRYQAVIGRQYPRGTGHPALRDPFGHFEILQAAYVDIPALMNCLHSDFAQQGCWLDAGFDYNALQYQSKQSTWQYQGQHYQRVIFCEGCGLQHNPWFRYLPLKAAKGETLLLQAPTLTLPHALYHHRKWLLAYPNGTLRLGSSYDEIDLSPLPTAQAYQNLLDAFHQMTQPNTDYRVIEQRAGHRPTTPDSRPILGEHPNHSGLFILNGLGSKGASLAPNMIEQLIQFIWEKKPLSPEVELLRWPETSIL
jgi:glycine/D-amino acid oxidase-like deaminating enzyme